MEPIRVIKVIGYNKDRRKSFNELMQSIPITCTTTENKSFDKFNISLTERYKLF